MMPVRGGPGKINVMGEASVVNPDVLLRIKKAIARGLPVKEAYQQENALPMIRVGSNKVEDAWVPVMGRRPSLNPEFENNWRTIRGDYALEDISNEPIKTTYGKIYEPYELETLAKYYPNLLNKRVDVRADDFSGTGSGGVERPTEVNAFLSTGRDSLKGVLAHEGTHDLARLYDLPRGYNSDATKRDLRVLRGTAENYLKEPTVSPENKALLHMGLLTPDKIPPGLEAFHPNMEDTGKTYRDIARALAWQARLQQQLKDPDYKLYRAYHGEQAAEGAHAYAVGETPDFTTPLSKQVVRPRVLSESTYPARLQLLYELKKAGLFDPLAQPFELPPHWRVQDYQQATK
jgi:hypothetical protein